MTWRPRLCLYFNRRSQEGTVAWEFGPRIGWWPCLKGPFACCGIGPVTIGIWIGLPSYRKSDVIFVL